MIGKKTGGRQKGTPNKATASVKAALEAAFDQLGGVDALVSWARNEQTEFYKLYSRLLPVQMKADVSHNGMEGLAERLARAKARTAEIERQNDQR